jgi:hypothetical protein
MQEMRLGEQKTMLNMRKVSRIEPKHKEMEIGEATQP